MDIQWFPGHMRETKELLIKAVAKADVVMEILDARIPVSSSNPLLDTICKNTLRLKILNKNDLADPETTQLWLDHFNQTTATTAIALTGTQSNETWRAADLCLTKVTKGKARRVRVMVVGIPNTGKSTIINTLAGKKVARTGNVPAITRQQQRTELKNAVDIYDTPGILWPVMDEKEQTYRLAAMGAISDIAIDYTEIACFTGALLMETYPDLVSRRYRLSPPLPREGIALLEAIAAKRGCLRKQGAVDYQKAAEIFIRELRAGKIGRISLETPEINFPSTTAHPLETLENI
ncbi:GTP-binding family protein (GTPase) [Desulforapulum autotrophicum HRM2]|uniref:Ribosome biogenesis GTPase A n=1 Tax=Desulforapulum autotrophicum (strain ATCC 43914 / DSM 3382 / VKM B-1955 / HRM2) TaxID=177437 RepID=C0QBX0_DESAH|nr:ribosome biogenesis GTPase YlqF [Desulforapulum autotrophicum]ACN14982.1 GTP-binding family protein (GTPase) [Desulforapulum autotrophicum HRM2]